MGTSQGSGRPLGSRDVIVLVVYFVGVPLWVVVMMMTARVELGLLCGLVGVGVLVHRVWLMLSKHRSLPTPPQATIKPDEPPGAAPDHRIESLPHWPS
jgi:hypothetical protein